MDDKQIMIDGNYYKELFKAFYNKRFKNVKEVRQLAESLGYETYCDMYMDTVISRSCVTLVQRTNNEFLYFKKDNFILENGYYGFASNLCNKNKIAKNIARRIYRLIGKEYPTLNSKYRIPVRAGVNRTDTKKFNADWKIVLEDVSNILEELS